MPDAPYHYACDFKWWDVHYQAVKQGFKGESYTINDVDKSLNPSDKYDLTRINSKQGTGLGEDCIHYGGNSGYQAVNLAYLKGAGTILLIGFDMLGAHYFGDHPKTLNNGSPFKQFIKAFEEITQDVEIINCSRMTALTCFPRKRIDQVL